MSKNIVLIGFMGAGKSLVSKSLAKELNKHRVSTDELIEERERKTISQIFEAFGEDYFRKLEEEVVLELSDAQNLIIDCGGGVVTNQKNLDLLKKNGTLFYLKTSPEIVYQRVKANPSRPLLQVADPLKKIEELIKQRNKFYEQADFTIDTDTHKIEDTVREVLKILNHE